MESEDNSTMSNEGGKWRQSRKKFKSATSTIVAAKWIKENTIQMRRCSYYIPSEDKTICQCGYQSQDHNKTATNLPKQEEKSSETLLKWNVSQHTMTEQTNSFGNIEFVDVDQIENIEKKFVRADIETDMSEMLKLMEMWGMEQPNLLISVTGGAQDFSMNPRLKDAFQRGLMKAVHSIGAWIVTGGTHTGVTKYIGEAVKTDANSKSVVAIGIAPWGVIHNRNDLKNKEALFEPARYHMKGNPNSNERFLDPNHSYFILVDDGTQHKFETEIPFRAKLEKKISQMKKPKGDVPVVMLVVGGGQSTLKTVENALQKDRPVVIVKGSGGVADILVDAFSHVGKAEDDNKDNQGQDSERTVMHTNLKADIHEKMKGICTEQDIDDNIQRIQDCLAKSNLVHIYQCGSSDQDLDAIMVEMMQKTLKPDDLMLYAIQSNRPDFVKLLLVETDTLLETFLRKERLVELYNISTKSIFMDLWQKKKEEDPLQIFKGLCCKEKKEIKLKHVMHLVQHLLGDKYLKHYEGKKDKKGGDKPKKEPDIKITSLDIFLWSVLNNKQDMAKLFWQYGEDKMAAALVAHALFSAMSRKIEDQELCAEIETNGSEFMTLAIDVAQKCYEADKNRTQHLLIHRMKQWGNATCIEIAVNAHDKGFISQHVCFDLFDKIWMGGLKQDNSIKILLACMAIPLLIPLLARFEEKEDDQQNSSNAESKIRGQKAICCFSLQRCKVSPASNDQSDGKSSKKKKDKQILTVFEKFQTFYRAPIIIFMHNVISFIAFLLLYSYVLISKLDSQISAAEIILIIWVASFFIGEVIQVSRRRETSICRKLKLYITDGWNILDMLTILLFIIGMAVLMIDAQPHAIEAAEVILGIDLALFYLRILHIFHAQRQIGPKLVMIINMVWDLGFLAAIIGVFILAYAISSYAILYPNTELTIDTVMAILKRPYWNIYGELMLEEIEGDANCSDNEALYGNGTVPRCPTKAGKYVVPIMMGIYMLMTNILLLSLLIATFSYSIEKVKQHTDLHCSLHRYNLICEYCTKPWLAHPFALLVYVLQIMFLICEKCYSICEKSKSKCEKCQNISGECQSQKQCDKCQSESGECQSKMQCEKCQSKSGECQNKMQCEKCQSKSGECQNNIQCAKFQSEFGECQSKMQCEKCQSKSGECQNKMQCEKCQSESGECQSKMQCEKCQSKSGECQNKMQCEKCQSKSGECQNKMQCEKCQSKSGECQNKMQCEKCQSKSGECQNKMQCEKCQSKSGECQNKMQCEKCQSESGECQSKMQCEKCQSKSGECQNKMQCEEYQSKSGECQNKMQCEKCQSKSGECQNKMQCEKCQSKSGECLNKMQCEKCQRKSGECQNKMQCEKCQSKSGQCQSKMQCGKCQSKSGECWSKTQCLKHCLLAVLTRRGNAFKKTFSKEYLDELRQFEKFIVNKLQQKSEQDRTESKSNTSDIRFKQLVNKFNELQQAVTTKQDMPGPSQKIMTGPEPSSTNLEKRVEKIENQLNSITNVLQAIDQKLGAKQTIPEETDVEVEC